VYCFAATGLRLGGDRYHHIRGEHRATEREREREFPSDMQGRRPYKPMMDKLVFVERKGSCVEN